MLFIIYFIAVVYLLTFSISDAMVQMNERECRIKFNITQKDDELKKCIDTVKQDDEGIQEGLDCAKQCDIQEANFNMTMKCLIKCAKIPHKKHKKPKFHMLRVFNKCHDTNGTCVESCFIEIEGIAESTRNKLCEENYEIDDMHDNHNGTHNDTHNDTLNHTYNDTLNRSHNGTKHHTKQEIKKHKICLVAIAFVKIILKLGCTVDFLKTYDEYLACLSGQTSSGI